MRIFTYKKILGIVPAVLFFFIAGGQPVSIRSYTDKKIILLGEPVLLAIETKANVALPVTMPDTIPHFEFLQKDSVAQRVKNGLVYKTYYYRLTSFDSGRWKIPAIVLNYNGQKYATSPLEINVVFTNNFNARQPYHDIVENRDVPVKPSFEKVWYIWAGALIIITLLIYWLTAPRISRPQPAIPTADEYSYSQAVAAIQNTPLLPGQEKEYYIKMVHTFRGYLSRNTGIASLQQTATGLADKTTPVFKDNLPLHNDLKKVLNLYAYVTYARYHPSRQEALQAKNTISDAVSFIEKNKTPLVNNIEK